MTKTGAALRRTAPPEPVPARLFPEGCFELRIAGCSPVVLTADTYFKNRPIKHWQIVRVLAVSGRHFRLPVEGRFLEAGQEVVFEPPRAAPEAQLAVPWRIVVSGEPES